MNEKFQAECGIEHFEFIVSERVQVNFDNSQAMSALTFLLLKLNTLHKPWCNDSGVLNLHHRYYTTIMTSRWLCRHNPDHVLQISEPENRCMKVE